MEKILVTGSSGFIGYHLSCGLLKMGYEVVGVDNHSDYYDVNLKLDRKAILEEKKNFTFRLGDIQDTNFIENIFSTHRPKVVINLAAQAGVRYSIENPKSYLESNVIGLFNILECARNYAVDHLMMASTSSVYGANSEMPYSEGHRADHQMSFYAATKKAGESMSHSYSHLYNIPSTSFRFFTVYGPYGRPDMALFKFTKCILEGKPIDVYNSGDMFRDFTYVDDLVTSIIDLMKSPPSKIHGDDVGCSPVAPWRVVNIGNSAPVRLLDFISEIEDKLGMQAIKNFMPMQSGDVPATWCDADLLKNITGSVPKTSVSEGVSKFVDWYRSYYNA